MSCHATVASVRVGTRESCLVVSTTEHSMCGLARVVSSMFAVAQVVNRIKWAREHGNPLELSVLAACAESGLVSSSIDDWTNPSLRGLQPPVGSARPQLKHAASDQQASVVDLSSI